MSDAPRFSLKSVVRMHMTDVTGTCRAADLLRIMQEAATMQLEHYGPNHQTLTEQGKAFVLSRISVDFPSPARYFERLNTETWPCASSRGFTFDRCFEIFRDASVPDDARLAARAFYQWALIDINSRSLSRVDEIDIDFTREESVTPSIPMRFRIPKDAVLEEVGTHAVVYTDIDINRHVNNTRYCDIYTEHLPMTDAAGVPQRIAAIAIAFRREATPDDVIRVTRTSAPDENGLYYIRTYLSSGELNTEAALRLCPIA